MKDGMGRRAFLQVSAGTAILLGAGGAFGASAGIPVISPGCRTLKVKVARVYMGIPKAHWPTPTMDVNEEMKRYDAEFAKRTKDFADVDFFVSELVTDSNQIASLKDKLSQADGILAIHLSMGVGSILASVLECQKPTVLFAAPYSGHEWTSFGAIQREPRGALLECMLTSDFDQLAVAVRPFRAIHHLREAKILNVTSREPKADYVASIKEKFGTEIMCVDRDRMMKAYEKVAEGAAKTEAKRWISQAKKVIEPSEDEVVRSCRLALAFENLLNEEKATAITVDCYGSMYRQLPAFPCIGFTRLNDMGLAGVCESDLASAMTFILLQSLSGNPGFVSDPTVDESSDGIILAHCLGSTKMEGPDGAAAPYKLRCIMERQEGAVTEVKMPVGKKVTQAQLIGTDLLLYFTGDAIDSPETERGCRTKITVKVDGDIETLWKNWSHGLHRVTAYGDLRKDLTRFCRFKGIKMVDEARPIEPTNEA